MKIVNIKFIIPNPLFIKKSIGQSNRFNVPVKAAKVGDFCLFCIFLKLFIYLLLIYLH